MKFKHFLLCSLLILSISCSLFKKAQAPKHDNGAWVMSINLQTLVNNFYSDLQKAPDKSYANTDYSIPNSSIRALAVYDSSRKHSDALMIIVHDAESRFHKYQAEHQGYNKLNNSQILAYKEGMDALLYILVLTENHYK